MTALQTLYSEQQRLLKERDLLTNKAGYVIKEKYLEVVEELRTVRQGINYMESIR